MKVYELTNYYQDKLGLFSSEERAKKEIKAIHMLNPAKLLELTRTEHYTIYSISDYEYTISSVEVTE